jgi:hypothetical protein
VPVLQALGVERVFTPSDYQLIDIMESIADLVEARVDADEPWDAAVEPAVP